jgi:hypothetical protein
MILIALFDVRFDLVTIGAIDQNFMKLERKIPSYANREDSARGYGPAQTA